MKEERNREWLTVSEAAEMLGVHPTTVRRWTDSGELPVKVTPGGHRRFLRGDLRDYIEHLEAPVSAVELAERAWADFALVETRDRLAHKPEPGWLAAFDEDHRDEKRALGRRLMALIMQHVSAPEGDRRLLIEARGIAARYAQNCLTAGLSASEALEATAFFRDTMTEVALQMPKDAHIEGEAQVRLLRKLNEVFNVIQIDVVAYYENASESNWRLPEDIDR
jgi:excisionase family DNA binding protein